MCFCIFQSGLSFINAHFMYISYALIMVIDFVRSIAECQYFHEQKCIGQFLNEMIKMCFTRAVHFDAHIILMGSCLRSFCLV
jgi:hypothetical protein